MRKDRIAVRMEVRRRGASLAIALLLSHAAPARAEAPEVWSQRAPLVVQEGTASEFFGMAVAISGDTAIVADGYGTTAASSRGIAFVFVRSGSSWVQQAGLSATDDAPTPYFGFPVAISGDSLIVGDLGRQRAYGFTRSGSAWSAGQWLVAKQGQVPNWWSKAVSLSGDTAVCSVPFKFAEPMEGTYEPATVFVFTRSGLGWLSQAKLQPDEFAWATSVSGDTLVIGAGASERLFVYTRTGGEWTQQRPMLEPPGATPLPSFPGYDASYLYPISISGDTFLVGAKRQDATGHLVGVVFAYVRNNGVWSIQAEIAPPIASDISFGDELSLSGDAAVITARGIAYFYARVGTAWVRQVGVFNAKFAADPVSVAVSGRYAVVAQPTAYDSGVIGSAYIYSNACTTDVDCSALGHCVSGTCRARCLHDSECPSGMYCPADGLCRMPLAAGALCDDAAGADCKEAGCGVCASGHCADKRCCESACSGTCEACAAAVTGGNDGQCLRVRVDQDPGEGCAVAGSGGAGGADEGASGAGTAGTSGVDDGASGASSGGTAGHGVAGGDSMAGEAGVAAGGVPPAGEGDASAAACGCRVAGSGRPERVAPLAVLFGFAMLTRRGLRRRSAERRAA